MSKKYLLYIHTPEFEAEPEKSGLVNVLLARHYKKLAKSKGKATIKASYGIKSELSDN